MTSYRCYPYLALSAFVVFAAGVGAVLLHLAAGGPIPAVVLGLGWLALSVLVASGWLLCVPSALRVRGRMLEFEAPLASGELRLANVRSLRPVPLLPGAAVAAIDGRVPLVFPVRHGFGQVAAYLARHPCRVPSSESPTT